MGPKGLSITIRQLSRRPKLKAFAKLANLFAQPL